LKPGFGRVFFIWRKQQLFGYGTRRGALTPVKAALTFLQVFVGARQHTVVATTQHAAAVNQTYL
jgi:hypothetical protein